MLTPRSITITGTGAVVALGVGSGKWVQMATPPGNALNVNIGASEVTVPTASPATNGVGFPVPPGWSGMMYPPISEEFAFYPLDEIKIGIAAGDFLYALIGG